jgi:endonuclease YncB( thermonuclease family)
MELASRIFSVLLGLAVIVFVLWPVTVPLGFGEVWWASRQAQQSQTAAPYPQPEATPSSPPADASKPQAAPQAVVSASPAEKPVPVPVAAPIAQKDSPAHSSHAVQAPQQQQAPAEQVAALSKDAAGVAAPQPATKTYYRVTVRDGGTIEAGSIVIRLAGLTARAADATCQEGRGKTWPCGTAAKAALARLIRGRAVTCNVPGSGEHNIMDARCSVGDTDLSAWMVRQGWAEPKDKNEALVQAAEAARADKIGFWRALQ